MFSDLMHGSAVFAIYVQKRHICKYGKTTLVYYLNGTNINDLCIKLPCHIINSLYKLPLKTLIGGFCRRPELKQSKLMSSAFVHNSDTNKVPIVKNCCLLDKCDRIQGELIKKLFELMDVNQNVSLMLDAGCGNGESLIIPECEKFHVIGVDHDIAALSAVHERAQRASMPVDNVSVVRLDLDDGLCFRENSFDLAISVSFLQWLCVKSSDSVLKFFYFLSLVLIHNGSAGIQFYPRNIDDIIKVVSTAEVYFKGALVSDFPHSNRGRKLFLILKNNK